MLLSLTGRGGLARGRLLNRHPPSLQQNVRVSVFADSNKSAAAGAGSSSSRSIRGYGAVRFTHQVSPLPPVVSVSPPSVIPSGSAFSTAPVAKRSALVTDPKLETIRREVAQLALQELQVRTKQEWNFGSQFLEKYGYQWEESEEGEVILTRDINRQRVRIRFTLSENQEEAPEEDDRDIVDADQADKAPQKQQESDDNSFKGKPMAIQVSRIDLKGKEVATVVFYCQCGPDNSIIVDGLGGEDTESWGLKFDSLSPMLKDKIIDFLCELEIAGDVSKYVREYAANLGETNVSSINRLHQFFSTDEK